MTPNTEDLPSPAVSASRCILTRVQLRHLWDMPLAFVRFRHLHRHQYRGLLRSAFVIESPRTFLTISLWHSEEDITLFGNSHEHVYAVRWSTRRAREIWSGQLVAERLSHRPTWQSGVVGVAEGRTVHAS